MVPETKLLLVVGCYAFRTGMAVGRPFAEGGVASRLIEVAPTSLLMPSALSMLFEHGLAIQSNQRRVNGPLACPN